MLSRLHDKSRRYRKAQAPLRAFVDAIEMTGSNVTSFWLIDEEWISPHDSFRIGGLFAMFRVLLFLLMRMVMRNEV